MPGGPGRILSYHRPGLLPGGAAAGGGMRFLLAGSFTSAIPRGELRGLNYRRASEETTDECLAEIFQELSGMNTATPDRS